MTPPTRRERAETLRPDFDWRSYDKANRQQVERSKARLGANRNERRLGIPETKIIDMRNHEEKMADNALIIRGDALQKTAWENVDEVKRHVLAAYGHGKNPLTAAQISAVVAIAWSMQLDPAPGTGHLQVWDQGGRLHIEPGYQGYIFKAQQQREIFYNPPRPMTQEEREIHGLQDGEIGAVCELYEMGRARRQKELGLPITPIIGIAIWRKGMNVANARTPFWMASKNSIKDAIRQLGLGFSYQIPQVDGFGYDRESDSWIEIKQPDQPEPDQQVDDTVLQGEIINALNHSKVETPVTAETPAPEQSGAQPGGDFPFEAAAAPANTLPLPAAPTTSAKTPAASEPEVARPRTVAQVFDWLTQTAAKQTGGMAASKLNKKQAADLVARMRAYMSNETAKHILSKLGAESSEALEYRQKVALMSWLPDKDALKHMPAALEWIQQEVEAIDAEMNANDQPDAADKLPRAS